MDITTIGGRYSSTEETQIVRMLGAIFDERCPGIALLPDDVPYYHAAAVAALEALGVIPIYTAETQCQVLSGKARCLLPVHATGEHNFGERCGYVYPQTGNVCEATAKNHEDIPYVKHAFGERAAIASLSG